MTLAKVRKTGGSLVLTIPKEIVEDQGIKDGEMVEIEVRKQKKSFFGAAQGIGPFTEEDEMKAHD